MEPYHEDHVVAIATQYENVGKPHERALKQCFPGSTKFDTVSAYRTLHRHNPLPVVNIALLPKSPCQSLAEIDPTQFKYTDISPELPGCRKALCVSSYTCIT